VLRAAFTLFGGSTYWTGGVNYFRNCFRVLRRYPEAGVMPVLFVSPDMPKADVETLAAELGEPPVEAEWLAVAGRARRFGLTLLRGSDTRALRAFRDHRVDVVLEASEYYGVRFPLPMLTWVADFQSHYQPQHFSWRARWRTYLGRRLQFVGKRLILLSSNDAAADSARFYPPSRGRTVVVPFAVLPAEGFRIDPAVPAHHGLPERYFYLPNQFWQHKNHEVVIEALALLRNDPGIVVAATGSPVDHRNPGHFERLQERVAALGLPARFRFLGLVPGSHVPQLAVQSVAVVNPSFFEGWSSTVEEAKSFGVPLVLSSIAVHREQARDAAWYFDPKSPDSAAAALLQAWRAPSVAAAERLGRAAASADVRTREFAQRLGAAFRRAAGRASGHADPSTGPRV
jgi:glycosyltransferase involved in cell wall biosynthesis